MDDMKNDELSLDDDIGIVGDSTEINDAALEASVEKTPAGIASSIAKNLTPAEKKKIEENKKKHDAAKKNKVEPKRKTIDEELEYDKDKLTDDELRASAKLQQELLGFIKEKADIDVGKGIKFLLPTGVDILDTIAGGGFAAGAVTLIIGNPGTFKSALLGQTIATNQLKYRGRVMNVYMDSEEATTKQRLISLGVENPAMSPHPAKTIEGVFKTIEAVSAFKELNNLQENPSIIAWDSIANTITEKEKESTEMDINKFIGLRARVISTLLPKYVAKLEEYNIGLLVVNQLREKIDMGMFKTANDLRWIGEKTMPGGNALKYNAFHMLLLKVKADLKPEEWGFNGVLLEAMFVKNKLFPPKIPIQLIVDFNKGVSNFWTNWHLLVQHKRADAAGGWAKLAALPTVKCRKKELPARYKENPEFKEAFDNAVREVIKTEYIDKYSTDKVVSEIEKRLESIIEQK